MAPTFVRPVRHNYGSAVDKGLGNHRVFRLKNNNFLKFQLLL